jgi:hypothetical protein
MQLSLNEAKLFRVLTDIFGHDHVIPKMRVAALIPDGIPSEMKDKVHESWPQKNHCLFTVVNHHDTPRLVVEFYNGFADAVDPIEEEHQRILPLLLESAGIPYITISTLEFEEALSPESVIKVPELLRLRLQDTFEGET